MDQAKERHVLGLDLIRFAAAAMVMAFHYQGLEHGTDVVLASGWVGVEVFFVLSGYVITFSAESATPTSFAKSRAIRLVPAVWICGTATAAVAALTAAYTDLPRRFFNSLFLWPTGPWVDGVYWTLPVEIAFYAFAWLTLVFPRRMPLAGIISVIALASGAYWLWRASALYLPSPAIAAIVGWIPWQLRMFAMVDFGAYFALGAVYREIQRDGITVWRVGLLLLCLAAGSIQISFNATGVSGDHGQLARGHHAVPILVWLAVSAVAPLAVKFNSVAWRLFGRVAPAIRLIGLSTYPLYLLHNVAVGSFERNLGPWGAALIAIAASLLVAAAIEPPAQRVLRRVLDRILSRRAAPVGGALGRTAARDV